MSQWTPPDLICCKGLGKPLIKLTLYAFML